MKTTGVTFTVTPYAATHPSLSMSYWGLTHITFRSSLATGFRSPCTTMDWGNTWKTWV